MIAKIDEQTFCIEEGGGMVYSYLLLGTQRAALIDTGYGLLDHKAAVSEVTDLPVDVINTHGHLDHISSNHRFERVYIHAEDEPVFLDHASYPTRYAFISGLLQEEGAAAWLPADRLEQLCRIPPSDNRRFVAHGNILDLGGRTLEIIHTPGHTPGSICILDRERRHLFTGDTVCDEGVLLQFDHSCSVSTFLESIRTLKSHADRFDQLWPAHHAKPIDHSFLDEYAACAEQIIATYGQRTVGAYRVLEASFGRIKLVFSANNI